MKWVTTSWTHSTVNIFIDRDIFPGPVQASVESQDPEPNTVVEAIKRESSKVNSSEGDLADKVQYCTYLLGGIQSGTGKKYKIVNTF